MKPHCPILERLFIEVVDEMIESRGMTRKGFGALVWPDTTAPEAKWQRIKNTSTGGKPQQITLYDACRMADVLGMELPSLIFTVCEKAKQRAQIPLAAKPIKKRA